jgi:hypothetical protein
MAGYFTGEMGAAAGLPGDIDTVARNPVGQRCIYVDATQGLQEYIYLKGVASCLVDDAVSFNTNAYVAVRLAASAVGRVAIASAAIVAANWGWFLIFGFYPAANSDAVAAAGQLFIDGTTGRVDTTSSATNMIYGAVATGAAVANKCPVSLSYPLVTATAPA